MRTPERHQLSICMLEQGEWEEEKNFGMQFVPAVTPLTSRGRLASRGVNPATKCQDLIIQVQVSESSSRRSYCVVSQCVSSSFAVRGPGKHSIKWPQPFFVNTFLPCLPSQK